MCPKGSWAGFEPLDSPTGAAVMIEVTRLPTRWPVILLQIDVNAIPIGSVGERRGEKPSVSEGLAVGQPMTGT